MLLDKTKIIYKWADLADIDLLCQARITFLKEIQHEQDPDKEEMLKLELKNYFTQALSDHSYLSLIAYYENKPVGFGGIVIQTIPASFTITNGRLGYILNMFTYPEYRGNGICTEIFERLICEAGARDVKKVYLHATQDGIEIYKKRGFNSDGWPELHLSWNAGLSW